MSFNEYHEWRELKEFNNNYNKLCQDLAFSEEDFDVLWAEQLLPILENSEAYNNEQELLNEFWGAVKNWMSMGGNKTANPTGNPSFTPESNPQMHQWLLQNDAGYAKGHARQQKLGQFQQQADQMTSDIKNRFSGAMRMFLKATNDDALKQQNPHLYKIANSFYNKIMAAAQPVMDQFKMTAKFGRADHSEFENRFNKMQGNQRAAFQNRMQSVDNRAKLASQKTGIPVNQLMAQRAAGNPMPSEMNPQQ